MHDKSQRIGSWQTFDPFRTPRITPESREEMESNYSTQSARSMTLMNKSFPPKTRRASNAENKIVSHAALIRNGGQLTLSASLGAEMPPSHAYSMVFVLVRICCASIIMLPSRDETMDKIETSFYRVPQETLNENSDDHLLVQSS